MKKLFFLLGCVASLCMRAQSDLAESTVTKVGALAPAIEVHTVDGKDFALQDVRGKVVLIHFFATWCGPCMAEMPRLQSDIWNRFKDKKFVMIAIDREETEAVVKAFQAKHQFGFPIACDPKREIYSKFATKYIPRNILVDTQGVIVFQSVGYADSEFKNLVAAIEKETAKSN